MGPGKQFLTCEQYLNAWYEPTDRIAVFVKNYGTGQTLQRIVSAKEAVTPKFQAWIQSLNQKRRKRLLQRQCFSIHRGWPHQGEYRPDSRCPHGDRS